VAHAKWFADAAERDGLSQNQREVLFEETAARFLEDTFGPDMIHAWSG
jgi:hypothetical protein